MARPRSSRQRAIIVTGRRQSSRKQYKVNQAAQKDKIARQDGEKSRPFRASYGGYCRACFTRWTTGAWIQRVGDTYFHSECVK